MRIPEKISCPSCVGYEIGDGTHLVMWITRCDPSLFPILAKSLGHRALITFPESGVYSNLKRMLWLFAPFSNNIRPYRLSGSTFASN
ncbi:hypothetical protein NPIL_648801 [Nephila pilipes]|uniref:Uncharacterized protein n=1 Tax=Nephila pilipes TaxID=299642 RepID=A0A8X6NCG0_NEPPI|nr:hypothetical protein NPIL_224501 [Nephila pilipes]GFT07176.1 hypothetical protein NPIL_648801 [Nephila pilipes]